MCLFQFCSVIASVDRGVSTTIVVSIGNMETLGEGAMATILSNVFAMLTSAPPMSVSAPVLASTAHDQPLSPSVPSTSTQAWGCPSDLDLNYTIHPYDLYPPHMVVLRELWIIVNGLRNAYHRVEYSSCVSGYRFRRMCLTSSMEKNREKTRGRKNLWKKQ